MRAPSPAVAALAALLLSPPPSFPDAKDAEAHFNSGRKHLEEGRPQLALEAFKKAIREDSKNPYSYKGLSIAHSRMADLCREGDQKCRTGHQNDAIEAARKALQLNPYFTDARNDLGIALLRAGKREDGRKELLAAYNDPTNPTPEFTARNIAFAYAEEENHAEALSWYRTSLGRNPKYPDAHLGAAAALRALGRVDEEVRQLETANKEVPGQATILVALGEAYYRAGRFTEARPQLEQAVRQDPGGPSGLRAQELLKHFPR
jgi:tetratricopeptide (TPR) repeat protein